MEAKLANTRKAGGVVKTGADKTQKDLGHLELGHRSANWSQMPHQVTGSMSKRAFQSWQAQTVVI